MSTTNQLHENFCFFRYTAPTDIDLLTTLRSAALPDVAHKLGERAVAPKSVSVSVITEPFTADRPPSPSEIIICIGYANDTAYSVSFSVTEIGTEVEHAAVLADSMATAADAGDVLCHDILIKGGKLYAVLMLKD